MAKLDTRGDVTSQDCVRPSVQLRAGLASSTGKERNLPAAALLSPSSSSTTTTFAQIFHPFSQFFGDSYQRRKGDRGSNSVQCPGHQGWLVIDTQLAITASFDEQEVASVSPSTK